MHRSPQYPDIEGAHFLAGASSHLPGITPGVFPETRISAFSADNAHLPLPHRCGGEPVGGPRARAGTLRSGVSVVAKNGQREHHPAKRMLCYRGYDSPPEIPWVARQVTRYRPGRNQPHNRGHRDPSSLTTVTVSPAGPEGRATGGPQANCGRQTRARREKGPDRR